MLFSEPKIPQFLRAGRRWGKSHLRFSALQRAENSSIRELGAVRFNDEEGFSALQRAENSSIQAPRARAGQVARFQCSSASRKFLNCGVADAERRAVYGFSALQRAENSSIVGAANDCAAGIGRFSALQRAENSSIVKSLRK